MWLFLICIIPNSKRHVKVTQRERERDRDRDTERVIWFELTSHMGPVAMVST